MIWQFEWFKQKNIYYEEILRRFCKEKIDYLLVGGLAVACYKVPPRFTIDVDLMVAFNPNNIARAMRILKELGYQPKVPVDASDFADPQKRKRWIKEKNMKVFAFYHPDRHQEIVDVFVEHPLNYNEMVAERQIIKIKGIEIPIPSKRHLIALKKIAGRPDDLIDIKNLEAIPEGEELRDVE